MIILSLCSLATRINPAAENRPHLPRVKDTFRWEAPRRWTDMHPQSLRDQSASFKRLPFFRTCSTTPPCLPSLVCTYCHPRPVPSKTIGLSISHKSLLSQSDWVQTLHGKQTAYFQSPQPSPRKAEAQTSKINERPKHKPSA